PDGYASRERQVHEWAHPSPICRSLPQVLIERLAADAELAGQPGFLLAGAGPAAQLDYGCPRQPPLTSPVSPPLLGQGNAFTLPLSDQVSLELRHRAPGPKASGRPSAISRRQTSGSPSPGRKRSRAPSGPETLDYSQFPGSESH